MAEAWIYDSQGYYVLYPPYNVWGITTPEVKIRLSSKPSSAQLKLYILRIRIAKMAGLLPPEDVTEDPYNVCGAVVNGVKREFYPSMPPIEKQKEYSVSITDLVQAGENTFSLGFTPVITLYGASIEYWIQLKLEVEGADIEEVVIPQAPPDFWSGFWQFITNNGPQLMQMLILIMLFALLLKIL